MKKVQFMAATFLLASQGMIAQDVTVSVDASAEKKGVSPYLYGRNDNLSDDPSKPVSASEIQMIKDAGVRFMREFGGNNGTKYNWKKKLTSHPDWYNNIYSHDWDYTAETMQANFPGVQGMWSFQLIGFAAETIDNNFNDWSYNKSAWWEGVNQNLAGGGTVNEAGGTVAAAEGDTDLYLQEWTADSSVAILDHWFGSDGIGLDKSTIRYWSMDNEPEIWSGTHDDIMPDQIDAEAFMQRYFELAKKARAKFPDIKLCGPVVANEWQWYNWNNTTVEYNGQKYPWLEYFIMRCSEEQTDSGIRLLDVVDLHFYPNISDDAKLLQAHRIFFDKNYSYPDANGIKMTGANGWDNSLTKEYIFERCNEWLDKYMGAGHNVGLGLTEYGTPYGYENVMVNALNYASLIETFAENDVEVFTPFFWKTGMWEVLHLYSNYSHQTCVKSVSDNEDKVSAFTTVTASEDSMTVILINRSKTESLSTNISIENFTLTNGNYRTLQLAGLPASETFKSHSENALQSSTANLTDQLLSVDLPPLSVTAVVLAPNPVTGVKDSKYAEVSLYPLPVEDVLNVRSESKIKTVAIFNQLGEKVFETVSYSNFQQIDCSALSDGVYSVCLNTEDGIAVKQLVK